MININESQTVEFKRQFVDDLGKTIIAFANANGGCIYIGIEDDGAVVGVEDTDNVLLRVSGVICNTIKPDVSMFITCEAVSIEDKEVIVIKVGRGISQPYYIAGKGIRPEGVYIRVGAATVPATETAILKMIRDTGGESFEQSRSLKQELSFSSAEKEFNMAEIAFGEAQKKTLRIVGADLMYTNLALLLSNECEHTIKVAVFSGLDKEVFQDRYEFTGSLLKQVSEAYDFIERYNRTSSSFDGLRRVDKRDYPTEAIREALLNAVVHRDYALGGSTLISIFDDRIEILSLGGLAKGIEYADIILGASISRNPNLANIFYRLHLIEAYGTGLPKVMKSYKDFELKPKIEVSNNAFKIILFNTCATMTENVELTKNEQFIMDLFLNQNSITRINVENALSVSTATATRLLSRLTTCALLLKTGDGKNTKYTKKKR